MKSFTSVFIFLRQQFSNQKDCYKVLKVIIYRDFQSSIQLVNERLAIKIIKSECKSLYSYKAIIIRGKYYIILRLQCKSSAVCT